MTLLSDQIGELRSQFLNELKEVAYSKDLEKLKTKYLGKKGAIQRLMSFLRNCSQEERPRLGKIINDFKEEILSHFDHNMARLRAEEQNVRLANEWIDVTLPGCKRRLGHLHPITLAMNHAVEILIGMGFSVQLGPDVDFDYYNFEGLNFALDHPARDMQDTFYLAPDLLLRTHTSNVQIHTMEKYAPPIRIVAPGRCFRNEDISSRSHVFFHQIEGFYIDCDVNFAELLATMDEFLEKLLGKEIQTRYRPSYFPFVEPGLEIDVSCVSCNGIGCRICKQTGWLEILGAGMVHPNVLKMGKIDPEKFSGFAWGIGIERLIMLLNGICDIRLFTENDLRFLTQFP